MRVLVISQYFWPESFRINEIANSLAKNGLTVDVLTGNPNYPSGEIYDGYKAIGTSIEHKFGLTIYRIPIFPRGKKSAVRLALNYISFVFSGIFFGLWSVRKLRPEVVFVYAPSPLLQAIPALLIAKIKGCPMVLWVQDLWPDSLEATGYIRNVWILWFLEKVVKFIYKNTDLILVSSRPFSASIHKIAPLAKVIYYPNSVENSFVDSNFLLRPDLESLKSGFTIVFAGNIGIAQSVETIINAAEILIDDIEIKFVIIGYGSRYDWMQSEVIKRELKNVILVGRYPTEAMPFLLSKAKALLVTMADNRIFSETVPYKIQAYMAVGRPIIGSLNGEGARIIKESGGGLTVPAEDAVNLSKMIKNLKNLSEKELNQMGLLGQKYFKENFDHEMLTSKLIHYFAQVSEQN